jgi:hypothetical protein
VERTDGLIDSARMGEGQRTTGVSSLLPVLFLVLFADHGLLCVYNGKRPAGMESIGFLERRYGFHNL